MASWFWQRLRRGLDPALAERVRRWRALPEPEGSRPPAAGRWVVLDVESSGLDANRDALISVGAVAVSGGDVDIADSFEVVLRQRVPSSHANIEVHGIGGVEQAGGVAPAHALVALLEFIGKDPLVAFHAPFDARMLERAFREHLGMALRRSWLDLADLAPLAWPGRVPPRSGLDGWLQALAIPVAFRHRAVVDCLATAQLLVAVQHEAPRLGVRTERALHALAQQRRWA